MEVTIDAPLSPSSEQLLDNFTSSMNEENAFGTFDINEFALDFEETVPESFELDALQDGATPLLDRIPVNQYQPTALVENRLVKLRRNSTPRRPRHPSPPMIMSLTTKMESPPSMKPILRPLLPICITSMTRVSWTSIGLRKVRLKKCTRPWKKITPRCWTLTP